MATASLNTERGVDAEGARYAPTPRTIARVRPLFSAFESCLPPSTRWRGEASLSAGNVSATAILRRRLHARELTTLLDSSRLAKVQQLDAQWLRQLPCWRHMVRLDDAGGLSLYLLRDFSHTLNTRLCDAFGVDAQLAGCVAALVRRGFTAWCIGVHWSPVQQTRVRMYVVAEPSHSAWDDVVVAAQEFVARAGLRAALPPMRRLLEKPCRACVVNLELASEGLRVKIELPEPSPGVLRTFLRPSAAALGIAPAPRARRTAIRQLGVRFSRAAAPDVTAYIQLPRGA